MKIIYSELKKFLPDLSVEPQQLRDDLTMIGHFTNFFEKIDNEIVFDLDIKVNRGDCLGYYGLAKDLSVFYNLPLQNLSSTIDDLKSNYSLPIQVNTSNVKRVMAAKICHIKNSSSPQWLQTFLKCHASKSINTIVDLTNYIMFLYGIPNHAFDTSKSTDNLIWEMNSKFKEFTSLDGSKLTLNNDILMINNPNKSLSLSFWGGEACAIDLETTDIIVEVAIYDRTTVRQNSRQLKSVTEASIRLEKDLDPELIPTAFNHLVNLILENCGGQITSQIFDHYPQKIELPEIEFNPQKASLVSGIEIPTDFSLDCLARLGCQINNSLITPPSVRKDISIEADLIEEVVRFWGYQKIPLNQPLVFKELADITPKEIYLIESLKDKLVELGYDEVLTWPLVTTPVDEKTVITTQNSINSEAIYLRQSLIPSLVQQLDQYNRFKLPETQFFEIGKVFSKAGDDYVEKNALGIYHYNPAQLLENLQQLNLEAKIIDNNFAEIIIDNLSKPENYIPKINENNAFELTSQIITLDANLILETKEDPTKLIAKYSDIIGPKILWKLIITDIYQDPKTNKYRYTFQASYFNTDDKTAKVLHLKTFDLI
ncbi:MAG: phenylalanine--tRNA ligase beta subunit-related protein [Candidatus Shapirobacteria bacterium]|nr:phenylalanine--tRNA ligase beta subunit-related protein [Candidatus Shapirobacteria bacterium]MDD4410400.1 phenylalanine--tRNA ligase beta subunit-related protein [Candidatus Shapirobacteria bacterium]